MEIAIACVGRLKAGPVREICEDYARRLPWPLDWQEIAEDNRLPPEKRKARDGEEIATRLRNCHRVVALDERGKDLDSGEFAALLAGWRDAGYSRIGFAIGGADGLADTVRARAARVIRFGRVTWPHMLMRALLAEQLYRAHTILTGHPYHRRG